MKLVRSERYFLDYEYATESRRARRSSFNNLKDKLRKFKKESMRKCEKNLKLSLTY